MEGLNLDNILDEDALSLFNSVEETETPDEETLEEESTEQNNTTEIDPEGMFGESESVGSGEKNNEEQEDTLSEGNGTSPKNPDFFSSIAEAFAEEGILPNLDEETIKNIKTPEDFRKAIDDYIKSELNELQLRVADALNNNVQPDAIRQYEGVLNFLNGITEDDLREESDRGEEIRKRLMFQDYINRGFSRERAEKEVNKALSNGTDIEDAMYALLGCREFYSNSYNKLLLDAKLSKQQQEQDIKQRSDSLRASMLDDKNKYFEDLDIDKVTRQKAYENISKPIYRDPKTGEVFTAIQKYEMDNSDEFLAKVGILFTLTDGFKSLDKLVGKKVKKGIKKGLRDLENKINNTSRDSFGNIQFASGVNDDESYLGKGIRLAL